MSDHHKVVCRTCDDIISQCRCPDFSGHKRVLFDTCDKCNASRMTKDSHTEHCCLKHGCKYGNENCTVVTGLKKQSWDCGVHEMCEGELDLRKIASRAHKLFCTSNHIDMCSWEYEKDDWEQFAHKSWLEKTKKLLGDK